MLGAIRNSIHRCGCCKDLEEGRRPSHAFSISVLYLASPFALVVFFLLILSLRPPPLTCHVCIKPPTTFSSPWLPSAKFSNEPAMTRSRARRSCNGIHVVVGARSSSSNSSSGSSSSSSSNRSSRSHEARSTLSISSRGVESGKELRVHQGIQATCRAQTLPSSRAELRK